ncbi:LpxL/LpxP family acyltransferase [Lysobacter sp. F6437]|uniref:LpxL/LpxP family acyltransferase n=1 Tax=Lysobacter sp. F6437 TaxID=3459296 RepID=UPI00403E0132
MSGNWKQRPEGGGWFAIWLIRTIARRGGRTIARLLLAPITLYFLIVRGPERRASREYLDRVLGRPARVFDIARHIHAFASTILDRVFMLGGQLERFEIGTDGLAELHAQIDRGQGLLLFGSHLGSFEVLRVLSQQRPDVTVRVVLDTAHNPAMTQLLDALNPEIARTVIDAGQDGPSIVLAIKQATDAGALVALLVDRTHAGQPSQPAAFLGDTARFPVAPWLIAAVLKVPVVLAFGLYRGGNRYDLAFELFSEGIDIPRPQRSTMLAELVQRYANRLQHHARNAPYNWFNFYDFWQTDEANDPHRCPVDAGDRDAARGAVAARRTAG